MTDNITPIRDENEGLQEAIDCLSDNAMRMGQIVSYLERRNKKLVGRAVLAFMRCGIAGFISSVIDTVNEKLGQGRG